MKASFSVGIERVLNSQTLTLGGSAVLVGLSTGAGIWLFKWLIELVRGFAFGVSSGWLVALVPVDCVIASVRRGGQVFIPRGETILRAGDVLVVVAEGAARDEVLRLCHQLGDDLPL